MKVATLIVALALAACAARQDPGAKLLAEANTKLAEADTQLAADDYTGAITSYTAFITAAPEHPQSARARATQKALERLVAAQAASARTQQGTDTARRELAEKQVEADRLRGEVAKLRGDLERLRSIDLQAPRQK